MGAHEEIWERVKTMTDDEWAKLRSRRDRHVIKRKKKTSWADCVGRISKEDLDIMEREIEEHCERIGDSGLNREG